MYSAPVAAPLFTRQQQLQHNNFDLVQSIDQHWPHQVHDRSAPPSVERAETFLALTATRLFLILQGFQQRIVSKIDSMNTQAQSQRRPLRERARGCYRANFSDSFIYPLKGVWYFSTHRYLWPLLRGRLVPLTILSTCTLVILFLVLYFPVVAFLALFHYTGSAWVNGTFFVLEIGSLLIALLFEALLVDHIQVDIFDAVMVAEGYEHLVKSRRLVSDDIEESDPVKRLGPREKGATFAPFSARQIIEFIIFLPLTFVPFAGVPLFILLTGFRAGPLLNWRYFALHDFSKKQRSQYIKIKKHRFEYGWFGVVHITMQLIPILSLFFLLTTAAGSALWSVHVEQEQSIMNEEQDVPQHEDYADDEY